MFPTPLAIAVFLENGNGGVDAAPTGSKIMSYYFGRQQKVQAQTPAARSDVVTYEPFPVRSRL